MSPAEAKNRLVAALEAASASKRGFAETGVFSAAELDSIRQILQRGLERREDKTPEERAAGGRR